NLDQFREKFGKDNAEGVIGRNYTMALYRLIEKEEFAEYDKIRAEALSAGIKNADKDILFIDMSRYKKELSQEEYFNIVVEKIEDGSLASSNSLNNYAWEVYSKSDDPELLNKALGWARKSIDIEKNYFNMDTYTFLLFKTGQTEAAEKAGNEAIELAKKEGMDSKETETEMEAWLSGKNKPVVGK
ncbi:MAG: hypothetical protein AAF570_24210, partial [Bacteroidota bacterium]